MTPIALLFAPLLTASLLATAPPVLVPPHADTLHAGPSAAPLIVPGRAAAPADTGVAVAARRARERYAMGRELERQGQPAAAIAAYRVAVSLDPQVTEAHFRMGRLYSAVGEHAHAAREYAAELRNQPGYRDARRWLGLELVQVGDTAAAIAHLESLVATDASDEPSWQALGFAYSAAGRAAQGEGALRRALQLDAKDADAWRDLGVLMASRHRDAEARDAYARATTLDPKDGGAWVNLGNLERRLRNWDAALAAYDRALARDSSLALAWRGRIGVLDSLGRPLDAARSFRPWLAQRPDTPALRMEAMERFAALGRKDDALALAREGVEAAPRSGEARLALGMALHESGDDRAALAELRRAQDALPLPEQRVRVGALIAAMRARAPDSLRALYRADSLAHPLPPRPDTAAGPARPGAAAKPLAPAKPSGTRRAR